MKLRIVNSYSAMCFNCTSSDFVWRDGAWHCEVCNSPLDIPFNFIAEEEH